MRHVLCSYLALLRPQKPCKTTWLTGADGQQDEVADGEQAVVFAELRLK